MHACAILVSGSATGSLSKSVSCPVYKKQHSGICHTVSWKCTSLLTRKTMLTVRHVLSAFSDALYSEDVHRTRAASSKLTNPTITDWTSSGGPYVKVIGLGGTRAAKILQFCQESRLIRSAELWNFTSSGEGLDFVELLANNNDDKIPQSSSVDPLGSSSSVIFLVLASGASLSNKPVIDALKSCKAHGGLCVMILIEPFNFEGIKRKKEMAVLAGSLREHIDLNFVFEYDALFRREKVMLADAMKLVNNTSLHAIMAVCNLFLNSQHVYFDAPPKGFREIFKSEILAILKFSGRAWVGFGSSYSVKSAVQRAAFESPFLQHLIPGMKGLVACTITCLEPKGRKDIQVALHTLRCLIGPRAELICTSVSAPMLQQGMVLATIVTTRLENKGDLDLSEDVGNRAFLLDSSKVVGLGYSSSINGRQLRRKSHNHSLYKSGEEHALLEHTPQEAQETSLSACSVNSEFHIPGNGNIGQDRPYQHGLEEDLNPLSVVDEVSNETEAGQKDASVSPSQDISVVAVGQGESSSTACDDIDKLKQNDYGSIEVDESLSSCDEKREDNMWRLAAFASILEWGKLGMGTNIKSLTQLEQALNSVIAEAWATSQQRPDNFSVSEKNDPLPFGVRPPDDSGIDTSYAVRGQKSLDPFDFVAPFGKALCNGIETMADIYNVATGRLVKDIDEGEERKQTSSFLSERATSMLENERSQVKLMPLVEMKFKNGMYKGYCFNGLPERKGRLTYQDGSFYDGAWKQGNRSGSGSFYYVNGDVFQGYWRDDQMHGKGWFYYHTGDRLYANFWKGKADGEGRYYTAKGDVFFGYFKNNYRHGRSVFIESGGTRWSELWDSGVLVSRTRLEIV